MKWILNWIANKVNPVWDVKRSRLFEYLFDYDLPLHEAPQTIYRKQGSLGTEHWVPMTIIPELNVKTAGMLTRFSRPPDGEFEMLDMSAGGYESGTP